MTIKSIYESRRVSISLSGTCRPLDLDELKFIEGWIGEQRTAENPDVGAWQMLWSSGELFFADHLETLIGQDIYQTIKDGASPVKDPENELSRWQSISPILQTIFLSLDTNKSALFDSEQPVLFRLHDTLDAIRLALPDNDTFSGLAEFERPDYLDVLRVLLASWASDLPKAARAREILCDLLYSSVCDARSRLSP